MTMMKYHVDRSPKKRFKFDVERMSFMCSGIFTHRWIPRSAIHSSLSKAT